MNGFHSGLSKSLHSGNTWADQVDDGGKWLKTKADAKITCHAHKRLSRVRKNKLRLNKDNGVILILRPSGIGLGPDIDNAGVYTPLIV